LDTTVVSELRRSRPHGGVVAWIENVDEAELYLASVTIGEIQAGLELSRYQNWAYPDFVDRSTGDMLCPSDFQAMTNLTKTRRQFTALQRKEAVELC